MHVPSNVGFQQFLILNMAYFGLYLLYIYLFICELGNRIYFHILRNLSTTLCSGHSLFVVVCLSIEVYCFRAPNAFEKHVVLIMKTKCLATTTMLLDLAACSEGSTLMTLIMRPLLLNRF